MYRQSYYISAAVLLPLMLTLGCQAEPPDGSATVDDTESSACAGGDDRQRPPVPNATSLPQHKILKLRQPAGGNKPSPEKTKTLDEPGESDYQLAMKLVLGCTHATAIEQRSGYRPTYQPYRQKLDHVRGYRLLARAADQGHPIAMAFRSHQLLHGYLVPIDSQSGLKLLLEARPKLRVLAESGNPEAQCMYGFTFSARVGVHYAPGLEMQWYRKAADQGSALGQVMVGLALDERKRHREAVEWYGKAYWQGFAFAYVHLYYTAAKGLPCGEFDLQVVAQTGLPMGQYLYAREEEESRFRRFWKVNSDGVVFMQKAADQGLASAQARIGKHLHSSIDMEETTRRLSLSKATTTKAIREILKEDVLSLVTVTLGAIIALDDMARFHGGTSIDSKRRKELEDSLKEQRQKLHATLRSKAANPPLGIYVAETRGAIHKLTRLAQLNEDLGDAEFVEIAGASDLCKSLKLLESAAARGSGSALWKLGRIAFDRLDNLDAARYWEKAAAYENIAAISSLEMLYRTGRIKGAKQWAKWKRKADYWEKNGIRRKITRDMVYYDLYGTEIIHESNRSP